MPVSVPCVWTPFPSLVPAGYPWAGRFATLNTCANPYLYGYFGTDLRADVVRLLERVAAFCDVTALSLLPLLHPFYSWALQDKRGAVGRGSSALPHSVFLHGPECRLGQENGTGGVGGIGGVGGTPALQATLV